MALAVLGVSLPAAAADQDRFSRHGIAIEYPRSWSLTTAALSDGVNPKYRLTVSTSRVRRTGRDSGPCLPGVASQLGNRSALAYVREALGADRARSLPRMQPRPRHFRLPTLRDNSLCGFGRGGRWIPFKEAGRAFYLGVYLGPRATPAMRSELRAVLDSLTIRLR
jgi:hypothetical protein